MNRSGGRGVLGRHGTNLGGGERWGDAELIWGKAVIPAGRGTDPTGWGDAGGTRNLSRGSDTGGTRNRPEGGLLRNRSGGNGS